MKFMIENPGSGWRERKHRGKKRGEIKGKSGERSKMVGSEEVLKRSGGF